MDQVISEETALASDIFDRLSSKLLGFKLNEDELAEAISIFKQESERIEEVKLIQKIKNIEDKVQHLQEEIESDLQKKEALKKVYKDLAPRSSIINPDNFLQIYGWLSPGWKNSKFKLIYRGSSNGMNASSFHNYCDNTGATITIMKSNYNKIFGGFNPMSWTSCGEYVATNESFLFSVTSNEKYVCVDQEDAVYDHPDFGPNFGVDGDNGLCIKYDFTGDNNWCKTNSYNLKDSSRLTGADEFKLIEIEVYTLESASDFSKIEEELKQINQTIRINNENLEGLEKKLKRMRESIEDKLLKEKVAKEEAEKSLLEEKMNIKKEIIESRKEQKAKEETGNNIEKRIEDAREDLKLANLSWLDLKLELEESEKELNKIKIEYEEIQSYKNKSPEEECQKIQTQIEDLSSEIFEIEESLENMKHKQGEEAKITPSDEEKSLYTVDLQEKTDLIKKLKKELEIWKNGGKWIKEVENKYEMAQKKVEDIEKEKETARNKYKQAQKELKDAQSAQEIFKRERQVDDEREKAQIAEKRQMEIDKKFEQTKIQIQQDMVKLREKMNVLGKTIQTATFELKKAEGELSSLETKQLQEYLPKIEEEVDFNIEKENNFRRALEAEIDDEGPIR